MLVGEDAVIHRVVAALLPADGEKRLGFFADQFRRVLDQVVGEGALTHGMFLVSRADR